MLIFFAIVVPCSTSHQALLGVAHKLFLPLWPCSDQHDLVMPGFALSHVPHCWAWSPALLWKGRWDLRGKGVFRRYQNETKLSLPPATRVPWCPQGCLLAHVPSPSQRLSGPRRGTTKSHTPPGNIDQHFLSASWFQPSVRSGASYCALLWVRWKPKAQVLQAVVLAGCHHSLGCAAELLYFLVPRTGGWTLDLS